MMTKTMRRLHVLAKFTRAVMIWRGSRFPNKTRRCSIRGTWCLMYENSHASLFLDTANIKEGRKRLEEGPVKSIMEEKRFNGR